MSEQQSTVDGFWVPSMREVWHQSFATPLMAQVPPELLPYRLNDDDQRTPFPGGFVPGMPDVTAIPRQVKVIKVLMLALRARGAAPASQGGTRPNLPFAS